MPLNLRGLNPQFLGLAAQAAGGGNVNQLAEILANAGGSAPTIAAAPQPFPVSPRGGAGGPPASPPGLSPVPAAAQAAPQALAAAAPQSAISPTSPGGILPGGSPGGPAPGGVNPLAALVPPTAGAQQQIPQAGRPGLGGQINPQMMQLILQALGAGGQPQQPAQSLGSILGQLR